MGINSYAIVADGVVGNVVLWDGESVWIPPVGSTANLLPSDSSVGPGYTFDGKNYAPPVGAATPALTPAQLAGNALAAGLAVISTSTPMINGTYAVDQLSQMDIIAIETSLNAGKGFPGGSASFNYADTSGLFHVFTATNFTDFAAAVRDYVYMLKAVLAGAQTKLPASTTTIA